MREGGAGRDGLVVCVAGTRVGGRLVRRDEFRLWRAVHIFFTSIKVRVFFGSRLNAVPGPQSPKKAFCRVPRGWSHRLHTDEFILHDVHLLWRQIYLEIQQHLAHKK